ncbi:alpha/beta hydrolase [Roseivirga pacifica]|uniref:alpha/beta hydrolase n=1 Tax=Roseivirga pacifica TaxID=1267423 RepID=UPI003BAE8762
MKNTIQVLRALALTLLLVVFCNTAKAEKRRSEMESFKVTLVDPENGSFTVSPALPADGMVEAGTELTIKAKANSGYSLDEIYYTVKGGMWGTTSYEFFEKKTKITVDKDMTIGANFIPAPLVEDLKITRDVVFAKPGVKTLKYDVYSPKGAEDLPMIVIIHGGGWSSNNEDIMRGLAWELTKGNQYVVASVDYRWINNGDEDPNSMHELLEDVFGAIAHIQENAAKYGGNPKRIAVTGDSAGGHLSASAAIFVTKIGDGGYGNGTYEFMPTYMPKGKSADDVQQEMTAAIKAAAPSYGVFDVAPLDQFIQQKDAAYREGLSPIKAVPQASERSVPHFLVRGTEDGLIPHAAVKAYTDELKSKGQRAEYLQVEGAGHAFFDWKPDARTRATFEKYGVPYAEKMKDFFDSVFY